jgi:SPP1 gp7 family putative phage head morphogenesis protein
MPDPEVIQRMRQFKAQLLERETAQVQQLVAAWRILESTLEAQIFALAQDAADLRGSGGVPSADSVFRLGRFEALIAQIDSELRAYTNEAENLIADGQLNIGLLGLEQAGASINSAAGIQVSFAALPVEAIENMVALAGDGSPLRTLLEASWPDAVEGLTKALIEGTALGRNPRVVARQMADGMAHSLNRMLNIARTEQLRVYREATRQQYIRSGVVEGFRRLATHDSRVCPACLMADGERYELDEQLREHPQGRCTLVPIIIGVDNPTWQLGPDWFRAQPPDTQRDILGPGRYAAWQDGAFDLDQLVSVRENETWGASVQPTPLKELVP